MNIELNLDNTKIILNFSWISLQKNGHNVYLWELDEKKNGRDQPVIYRFVLVNTRAGKITVYVGEGESLNGPRKNNLASQWKQTPGETRQRVKESILQLKRRGLHGWTEILLHTEPNIDLSDEKERKFLQELLISAYYQEHRKLYSKFPCIPGFLNKPE